MNNYQITPKGEDFVEEFYSHWQGAGDPAIAITFLWWLREDGDFQKHFQEVLERSDEQKAIQMVQWAVDKGYLATLTPTRAQIEYLSYINSPRARHRDQQYRDYIKNSTKAQKLLLDKSVRDIKPE